MTKAKTGAAVNAGAKQVEEAVANGKKTVSKAVSVTKEQVEQASQATLKGYDDFAAASKENLDAIVAATNVFSKGVEELGKAYFAFAQSSIEANVEVGKSMLAAKTVTDVVEMQADAMRNGFDAMVNESNKLAEMSLKLATDSVQPLQDRFNSGLDDSLKSTAA